MTRERTKGRYKLLTPKGMIVVYAESKKQIGEHYKFKSLWLQDFCKICPSGEKEDWIITELKDIKLKFVKSEKSAP